MLIKEYRIPLPLTLEEYRIAQLYMIQKKSRVESEGEGSAVEIIENHPYKQDSGEQGQYTHKIYHIERHIPKWSRSLVPKDALEVHEESWNAYPYTRTRFFCPFIDKFSLDIETYFYQDNGSRENVFGLKGPDLHNREVDYIDIVNDRVSGSDYKEEEDPRVYQSTKTGRGPLSSDWRDNPPDGVIMCAYKLCKVQFKYWGLQSKVERFIHDYALRRVMLRAHCQAWAWQDEWVGLTIEDIRRLERETQIELRRKLGRPVYSDEEEAGENSGDYDVGSEADDEASQYKLQGAATPTQSLPSEGVVPPGPAPHRPRRRSHRSARKTQGSEPSRPERVSSDEEYGSTPRQFGLEWLGSYDSDEEYLDAHDYRVAEDNDDADFMSVASHRHSGSDTSEGDDATFYDTFSMQEPANQGSSPDYLFIVVHGGSACQDPISTDYNFSIFRDRVNSVLRSLFPSAIGRIALQPVFCPPICEQSLSAVISLKAGQGVLDPDASSSSDSETVTQKHNLPALTVALMAVEGPVYQEMLDHITSQLNEAHRLFLESLKGEHFTGKVCVLADCMGAVAVHDILVEQGEQSHRATASTSAATYDDPTSILKTTEVKGPSRVLQFQVSSVFAFGSPLGIVLANRQRQSGSTNAPPPKPQCKSFYNLMYSMDPLAYRIEPLLAPEFSRIPAVCIPRLRAHTFVHEHLAVSHQDRFSEREEGSSAGADAPPLTSRPGSIPNLPLDRLTSEGESVSSARTPTMPAGRDKGTSVVRRWWGDCRIDYILQSPVCGSDLAELPLAAQSLLMHSRYWEAKDMISFIVQMVLLENALLPSTSRQQKHEITPFLSPLAAADWTRRTTQFRIRGMSPSHRAQDAIALEDGEQTVCARFGYGPLSLQSLEGEQVDIHILTSPPKGEWVCFNTLVTDRQGKVVYCIPEEKRLHEGMYPVKFVVRGDGSAVNCHLAIVRHHTNAAVFSIDGSFAAKFTVTGRDPKLISGSVEVVQHYEELGHLIIYISSRPDFQKETVLKWLGNHQFPLGIISFNETLSKDLNLHKKFFLGRHIKEGKITIRAAYGAWRDLQVYHDLGLQPDQIFIFNKGNKKQDTKKPTRECQVIDDHYQSHTQDLLSMRRPLERENMHNSLLRSSNVTLLSTVATGGVYSEHKKVRSRP